MVAKPDAGGDGVGEWQSAPRRCRLERGGPGATPPALVATLLGTVRR